MMQKYDRKYYVRGMMRLHFQCKCVCGHKEFWHILIRICQMVS